MKKTAAILMAAGMAAISLTGCLGSSAKPAETTAAQTAAKAEGTDATAETSGGGSESAADPAKDAVILKYSATCPPVGTQADGALKLGELIKEYSGGELVMEFYPSSQLGDKVETLAGLQNGTIEFTELAATDLSSYDDIWSVFSLPYMFDSGEQAVKVLSDPEVAAVLEKSAEDSGFKIISWWNFGERSILNAKKPVTNPSDLKGLNIRCKSLQEPLTQWGQPVFLWHGVKYTQPYSKRPLMVWRILFRSLHPISCMKSQNTFPGQNSLSFPIPSS